MSKPAPKLTEEPREASKTRWLTIRVPIIADTPEGTNLNSGRLDGRLTREGGQVLVKIMHALRAENLSMRDGGVIDLARPGARIATVRWIFEQISIAALEGK